MELRDAMLVLDSLWMMEQIRHGLPDTEVVSEILVVLNHLTWLLASDMVVGMIRCYFTGIWCSDSSRLDHRGSDSSGSKTTRLADWQVDTRA